MVVQVAFNDACRTYQVLAAGFGIRPAFDRVRQELMVPS